MKRIAVLSVVTVVAACAARTGGNGVVIPYENGRLVSTASARTEHDALVDALAAAKDECATRKQSLAVVKETTEYRGVVDREVVKSVKQIEEIITEGAGKIVPDLSTDEDYKVSLEFRCSP